ncbi:hypothetical protein AAZX31_12G137000 [Glycine max]
MEGQRSVWWSAEEHKPQTLATGTDFQFKASWVTKLTNASSLPSSFLVSDDADEFVATSCTPLMTMASFLVLNCWELEAIFSIKFLASAGVMSLRAPPLAASIILLSILLSPS